MPEASDTEVMTRDATILLLAIAGAGVDAAMILGFGVLTAAQSGNTVLLAVSLAESRFASGLNSGISVLGYVIGAAAGELVIVGHRDSEPWPSAVRRALLAELVPLGCLLVGWHLAGSHPPQRTTVALIAVAAFAMGIQSVAVLRVHAGPTTTYVTGTLTTFTTEMVRWLRFVRSAPAASPTRENRRSGSRLSRSGPWMYGATWIVYLVAAVVAGLVFTRAQEMALLLPIVAILAVIATDARRPVNGRGGAAPFGEREE
jgi:uncharacterized membrane protein YoaK (UPF0700 family)